MNCNCAAGILDTQAMPQPMAAVPPAADAPQADSFQNILVAQDIAESTSDAADQPSTEKDDPARDVLSFYSGAQAFTVPLQPLPVPPPDLSEIGMPISDGVIESSCTETSQPSTGDTAQSLQAQSLAKPQTQLFEAFHLEPAANLLQDSSVEQTSPQFAQPHSGTSIEPMQTALEGVLTFAPRETATASDTAAQPAAPAPSTSTALSMLKSADSAAANRHGGDREQKPAPQRQAQSTFTPAEAPRTETIEAPAHVKATRPAPGVEMTQRIEAVQTLQSTARATVQSITIPVGHESNPVATLRLVQQAAGIHLTVQTADSALSQSMQANLPQLIRGLEDSGFQANIQARSETAAEVTTAPVRTASTDNRQAGSSDQGATQQDGSAPGQGREKRQPSHEWRQWLQHGRKQNKEGK